MDQKKAYAALIKLFRSPELLAGALGISNQAVYAWKGVIPERQLDNVMKAMRKMARREASRLKRLPTKRDFRPDLYPKPRGAGRDRKPNGETRGKEKTSTEEAQRTKGGGPEKAPQVS